MCLSYDRGVYNGRNKLSVPFYDRNSGIAVATHPKSIIIIVFSDCNGDDAFIALERLRKTIQDTPIIISDITLNITMTFGLAELSFKRDAEATIKQADEKLYIGKNNGRNQVVY